MVIRATSLLVTALLLGAAALPSSPDLGKKEGQCRRDEQGPSLLVDVEGLKVFRRVEVPVPQTGSVRLCIRVPGPGTYAVSLLHDRDGNRKFGWTVDGIGFSGNPKLGWSKPKAARVAVTTGAGPTLLSILMNYRSGLGVAPLKRKG